MSDGRGAPLDGDGDGLSGGNHVSTLHRFSGDADGDGDVDGVDLAAFRRALGRTDAASLALFDFDGDGDVDGGDLAQFRKRFGRSL